MISSDHLSQMNNIKNVVPKVMVICDMFLKPIDLLLFEDRSFVMTDVAIVLLIMLCS